MLIQGGNVVYNYKLSQFQSEAIQSNTRMQLLSNILNHVLLKTCMYAQGHALYFHFVETTAKTQAQGSQVYKQDAPDRMLMS